MLTTKQRLYWSSQIVGWTFYASVQIITTIFAYGTQAVGVSRSLFLVYEAVCCLIVTNVFRHYINKWKWMSLGMSRLIPRVILSVFLMGVTTYFLRMPVSIPLGLYDPEGAFDLVNIVGVTLFFAIIYFLWCVLYFVYNYFESYNKSLRLEASMRGIELSNLKAQLNPHFIFNALNSIRALVDEDPVKAKHAINQMSGILRHSLSREKRDFTNFDDELRMVKDYLGLESIRFEERLKIEFDIDPRSGEFLIPPLMIQTLVENGIKHGISKLTEGGIVQVRTRVEDKTLKIQIRNSGKYLNGKVNVNQEGVGLQNTRQRLRLLYGDKATFRISNENNSFVLTEIAIPQV